MAASFDAQSIAAFEPDTEFSRGLGRLDMHDPRAAANRAVLRIYLARAAARVDIDIFDLAAKRARHLALRSSLPPVRTFLCGHLVLGRGSLVGQ
jgi:hypothetical protein